MFIQSFYDYEYKVGGVLLPRHHYSESEQAYGKRNIVEVTQEQYEEIIKDEPFNELKKRSLYRILETLPDNYRTSNEVIKEKNDAIALKDQEIAELKAKLQEAEQGKKEIVKEFKRKKDQ